VGNRKINRKVYSKLFGKRRTEQSIQFRRRYKGKTEEVGPRSGGWRLEAGKNGLRLKTNNALTVLTIKKIIKVNLLLCTL
jgi:hypothetical protein